MGLDNTPLRSLNDAADIVTKPSTEIINASLRQGKVPDAWKSACVIPLFKKGKVELWIIIDPFLFFPPLLSF